MIFRFYSPPWAFVALPRPLAFDGPRISFLAVIKRFLLFLLFPVLQMSSHMSTLQSSPSKPCLRAFFTLSLIFFEEPLSPRFITPPVHYFVLDLTQNWSFTLVINFPPTCLQLTPSRAVGSCRRKSLSSGGRFFLRGSFPGITSLK